MKVLHLNAGNETGGGMFHILSLLKELNTDEMVLGVFEQGPMYHEAKQLGINVICFEQESRFHLTILKKLSAFIKAEGIDIVHTHGARANLYGFLLKKFAKCECKWITTIHSDPRDDFLGYGFIGKIYTRLHLFSIKTMDHYFAISTRFKEMLQHFGIKQSIITTIYNGINFDTPAFAPITREQLGLTKKDFVIIMIARLHPVKGHFIAFRAITNIVQSIPNVHLLVVGDGPMEDELKQSVKKMKISEHVTFTGYQENIHGYLSMSDLMILTSHSESFPLVILEAARAQVPVISTDVGGVKDLITEPKLGWVIPQKDPIALEKAMKEAYTLKGEGVLPFIGINLYEKASAEFSLQQFSDSVYKAYEKIINQKQVMKST
ncbi:glycosyltransferase [Bacillus sp. PS06]|uniref:glycosyltransferase n=1 Tax=Bacillus sp. PS06 TaxID=2764176 RepID=UPI00177AACF4|nr:glycosyltransferase [Bacillus sp. PS06]MBD8070543.1 glycosyltransferase [Bacillus sp. PS06]